MAMAESELPEVLGPWEWENEHGPKWYYAISTAESGGIVAYAATEDLAEAVCLLLTDRPELRAAKVG